MSDLVVNPGLGQDVVVVAPTGTKLGSKVSYNSDHSRVRVKNTGTPPVVVPPPPTGTPSFLSRPLRANVVIDGGTDVELSNFTVRGAGIGITLRNVTRAWVHDIDAADLVGFVYIYNSTDVRVEDCRARNIGDGTIGSGHSNFVQFAESRGGAVRRCSFVGGRHEDMISTWHSGGWGTGRELVIEDNHLQGLLTDTATAKAFTSTSGTGVILSDGAGSPNHGYIIVRRNTFLNPGQVGIQHIDGPGLQTYENVIYGAQHPRSNNPMTSWEGTPIGEVHHNRYYWRGPTGALVSPWFQGGVNPQINAHDNVQDPTIDPATLVVTL